MMGMVTTAALDTATGQGMAATGPTMVIEGGMGTATLEVDTTTATQAEAITVMAGMAIMEAVVTTVEVEGAIAAVVTTVEVEADTTVRAVTEAADPTGAATGNWR